MHPLIKILAKVVIALTSLAVLLSCVGASYQVIGTWRDARRFPQQGRTVQAGNVRLNIDCSGSGSPTIILESGMGVPAMSWRNIQSDVAKFSRVCSYDRAGYGWSEVGPKPRTSQQIAHELRALLDELRLGSTTPRTVLRAPSWFADRDSFGIFGFRPCANARFFGWTKRYPASKYRRAIADND